MNNKFLEVVQYVILSPPAVDILSQSLSRLRVANLKVCLSSGFCIHSLSAVFVYHLFYFPCTTENACNKLILSMVLVVHHD